MPEAAIAPAPSAPAKSAPAPAPAKAPAPKPAAAKPAPAPAKPAPKNPAPPAPRQPQVQNQPKAEAKQDGESMFDAIDRVTGTPPKPPEPEKKVEAKTEPKPDEVKTDEERTEPDPDAKPDQVTPDSDPDDLLASADDKAKPESGADKKPPTPWQLVREKEKRIKELEAELKKPKEDPEVKTIRAKAEAAQKRLDELENEIKFVNYEKSQEYQDQYHKPYVETYQNSQHVVTQLRVTDQTTGEVRMATPDDFRAIMAIPNEEDAINAATELFGSDAKVGVVMQHRNAVRDAWLKSEKAKEEYRTKGSEREKQVQEERSKQSQAQMQEWEKQKQEFTGKYPEYFKPEDGDEQGNTLLKKGTEMADASFTGGKPNPKRDAIVRSMAAAFPRLHYKFKAQQKAIEELQTKLAEYESSEPGPGTPPDEGGQVKEPTMNDLIDAAAGPGGYR